MKTLIVSYSLTGNNEILANHLQKRLGADMFRVEERKRRTGLTTFLDILFNRIPEIKFYHIRDLYDHYVIVGPVWAGRIASPLSAFLHNEKPRMGEYSFISACGGAPHQQEKIARRLLAIVGHKPSRVAELSIGRLLKSRGTKRLVTTYRLQEDDLEFFKLSLDEFVSTLLKKRRVQREPANYQ